MTAPVSPATPAAPPAVAGGGWTGGLRRWWLRKLPPEKMLPDSQPAYVASWIYVFGVLTLSALLVVLVTGGVLALKGPSWWHFSGTGHYVNSLHLWSVELFMFFMVIHLWGKFFMAAWRGRRALTWMTGAVAFLASVGTAFTGYLVQQNFDSQWISTQAKDGLNASGIGAFFNVLDFGQMLMWHIVLLPFALGLLTIWHILLVRRRGVVPPLPRHRHPAAPATATAGPAGSASGLGEPGGGLGGPGGAAAADPGPGATAATDTATAPGTGIATGTGTAQEVTS